jgi:two-component system KDP operon response regulator KdpE
MNGGQVLRQLRQSSNVPVVILASFNDSESEVRCLEDGADAHVLKPFDRDMLLARCRSVVRRYMAPARPH